MVENGNSYAVVNLDRIQQNFAAVAGKTQSAVMAVVKADAYGHGAVQVAKALETQCAFFGVSSLSEAMELRREGLGKPILILGHTPPDAFPTVIAEGIRPAIFQYEDAVALSREAVKQNRVAPFHFAVDTGMSRIGFQVSRETAEICARIAQLPQLQAEGLFSHYATADCADLKKAREQTVLFDRFDGWLRELGVCVPLRHMDNSAGLMNFSDAYEMVRAGIVTYGLYPSPQVDPRKLKIAPALEWHSRVSYVKTLPAGREISYGGCFVTQRETVVATVPVGYADGYMRSLSGKFYVLIRGQRAPILGRICMDQMMVDVTGIPGVKSGDGVVLVGQDGTQAISVEEIAEAAGSFSYEFVCGISRRVPRIYQRDGKLVCKVHYLEG